MSMVTQMTPLYVHGHPDNPDAGPSVYPETETRVAVLSVTDGFLNMIRFCTRIVLLPRYRILLAHLNLYYL